MGTGVSPSVWPPEQKDCTFKTAWGIVSPRPISTRQLNALLRLHLGPINLVVYEGSYSLLAQGWEV